MDTPLTCYSAVSSIFSSCTKKEYPCDDPESDREREIDVNGVLGGGSWAIRLTVEPVGIAQL